VFVCIVVVQDNENRFVHIHVPVCMCVYMCVCMQSDEDIQLKHTLDLLVKRIKEEENTPGLQKAALQVFD